MWCFGVYSPKDTVLLAYSSFGPIHRLSDTCHPLATRTRRGLEPYILL